MPSCASRYRAAHEPRGWGGVLVLPQGGVAGSPSCTSTVRWLAFMNILLAAFNLLPGSPLDGGRVLSALLWLAPATETSAEAAAARFGQVLGAGLLATGALLAFGDRNETVFPGPAGRWLHPVQRHLRAAGLRWMGLLRGAAVRGDGRDPPCFGQRRSTTCRHPHPATSPTPPSDPRRQRCASAVCSPPRRSRPSQPRPTLRLVDLRPPIDRAETASTDDGPRHPPRTCCSASGRTLARGPWIARTSPTGRSGSSTPEGPSRSRRAVSDPGARTLPSRARTCYRLDDGVAVITLDDGKANAISHDTPRWRCTKRSTAPKSDVWLVVITGRQGKFSAGFDLGNDDRDTQSMRSSSPPAPRCSCGDGYALPTGPVRNGHVLSRGVVLRLRPAGAEAPAKISVTEVAIGRPSRSCQVAAAPAPAGAAHPRPHGGAHLRPRWRGRCRLPRHRRAGVRPPDDGAGRSQGARRAPHGRLRVDEVDDPRRVIERIPRDPRRGHVVHDRTGERRDRPGTDAADRPVVPALPALLVGQRRPRRGARPSLISSPVLSWTTCPRRGSRGSARSPRRGSSTSSARRRPCGARRAPWLRPARS